MADNITDLKETNEATTAPEVKKEAEATVEKFTPVMPPLKEEAPKKEKAAAKNSGLQIEAGYYTCDRGLQVVRELKIESVKNKDGTIARTYGTWNTANNFIKFGPDKKTLISEEELNNNKTLQILIKKGTLKRTF